MCHAGVKLFYHKTTAFFEQECDDMVTSQPSCPPAIAGEVERQLALLKRGVAQIVSEDELRVKLASALQAGRPLRVKLGMDPSAPDVHLGHTVVLNKLRQFQELGHEVFLIIGDFTGRIGDPTGKKTTRPQLSEAQIKANAATYAEQVFKVLIPERTQIVYNNDWLGRLTFADVIRLASGYTVARMLEREDFRKRYAEQQPIALHEFLYPLAQAYDSVHLQADVELGGTDQLFNLMVVRDVQRAYGQEPEVAIVMPLLVGTDGVEKMSKSLGNYIGVTDAPQDMYGKVMSIPDEQIIPYFELLTDVDQAELERMDRAMAAGELNPRDAKMRLARTLVARFHDQAAAEEAEQAFVRVFQQRELPEEMPVVTLAAAELEKPDVGWAQLLVSWNLADSNSEARRLIRQGALRVDGERIDDELAPVALSNGAVIRLGKRRFVRVELT